MTHLNPDPGQLRLLLLLGLHYVLLCGPAFASGRDGPTANTRVRAVAEERQPVADLGNGLYRNPILAGDYADVAVVRVGADYYLTHCCGNPRGMLAWHSRDLVNWEPYAQIPVPAKGSIWAPELVHYHGFFYLYLPLMPPGNGHNWVMTAPSMRGPWTTPVDLGVPGIDPGHIVDEQGNRFLYVDAGRVIPMTPDGLGITGTLGKVYDGWQYPEDWVDECFCLEAPKLFRRGEYYYLISAQGGTAGPATSHMAVVARSRSPIGPWENSRFNPLIRTQSRSDRWWSQGHGVLIDDIEGNWWMLYHAIENGYRSLGRQTLLMPIEWTEDNWPRVKGGAVSSGVLTKPAGENVGHGLPISDSFDSPELGWQWNFKNAPDPAAIFKTGGGQLRITAGGRDVSDAPTLLTKPVNHAYEAQVEVRIPANTQAGLIFSDDDGQSTGGILRQGEIEMAVRGRSQLKVPWTGNSVFFKLVDQHHDISVFFSRDGRQWRRFDFGVEFDGVSRLKLGLFAAGEGTAIFRDFRYHGLD